MKIIITSTLIGFAGMFGVGAQADATPVHETIGIHLASGAGSGQSPSDGGPTRPGGKTHFPRNGMVHEGEDEPVTGQGPNKGTTGLNDSVGAALGK